MAGSKATRTPNVWDRLREQNNTMFKDKARNRRVFNPQTVAIPPNPEIPPAGKSGSDTGNMLPTAGGTMIGAIAYFPKLISMTAKAIGKPDSATSNVLDISKGIGADTSRVFLAGVDGVVGDFDLEFIQGGQYAGQYLNIQGIIGNTITIKNDLAGTGLVGFNIRTQTGDDVFLEDNANLELIFDSGANQWALITGGVGEQAALNISRLSVDQPTAGVVGWDLNFPLGDVNRIIPTATAGVFEIVGGLFQLEGVLGLQMIEAGAGSVASAVWQSATTEGGIYSNIGNNSTVLSTFATGRPEITTQPHASVIANATGTSIFVRLFLTVTQGSLTGGGILNLASFASIEFLNPKSGGSGGGGGGASSLDQLSDVSINPNPPIANDLLQFSTINGVWENQPASAGGGLLVDLSNLQAGAVPPVDMSLNNFDLENVTEIRMNAAGNGLIDNVQHLDFFQVNHNIQSFGDRIDYQVDSADSHNFINGSTQTAEIRTHGMSATDYRFLLPSTGVTQNVHQITIDANNFLNFNVPDLLEFRWTVNNQQAFSMSDDTLRGDFFTADLALITLNQANAFPPDGWIQNFNNDVIIGSGGNFVNVTDLFNSIGGQFEDSAFAIFNTGDNTKVATFDAAAISTGNTRTYNFQDANGRIAQLDGLQQDFTVNVGLTGNTLQSVGGIFTDSALADIGQNTNYFDDLFIEQIFFFRDSNLQYKIGGDTSDGFDFVVPSGRQFEFYFDGSGTTPNWQIGAGSIGANGNFIAGLSELQFDGSGAVGSPSAVRQIGYDGNSFFANMPTGGILNLLYNGESRWTVSSETLIGDNIILQESLNFNDSVGNPLTGQIVRNGADLLVSTTEGVKNMKDIGGGAGGGNTGTIEAALWTDGETNQYDFFVWHNNSNNAGTLVDGSIQEDVLYYVPIFIGKTVDILRLGVNVVSASGSFTLAMALYSNRTDGQNYPLQRVATSSQIHAGAGFKTVLLGGQEMVAGLYWIGMNFTNGPSSITIKQFGDGNCHSVGWSEDANDLEPITGYLQLHSSSSLPVNPDDEMVSLRQFGLAFTPSFFARFT